MRLQLKSSNIFQLTALSVAVALAGCGGGGDDSILGPKPELGPVQDAKNTTIKPNAQYDILFTGDTPELKTGGGDKNSIKVVVRVADKNGGVIAKAPVTLDLKDSKKYGVILNTPSKLETDEKGEVELKITQTKQGIDSLLDHEVELTATVNEQSSSSTTIFSRGTKVEGATADKPTLFPNQEVTIQGRLVDGNNQPIANAQVALVNNSKQVSNQIATTASGNFSFTVASNQLQVTQNSYIFALSVQGKEHQQLLPDILQLAVGDNSGMNFANTGDLPLNEKHKITLSIPNGRNGQTVSISTTKGLIYDNAKSTDGRIGRDIAIQNGQAVFYIESKSPGNAMITANDGQHSHQAGFTFVAIKATNIDLQAEKSVLNKGQSTEIKARVSDGNDAPVKNALVKFSIDQDASGGRLSQGEAYTDENGEAVVRYTAGRNATANNGVKIIADVRHIKINNSLRKFTQPLGPDKIFLTVNNQSANIAVQFASQITKGGREVYYYQQASIVVTNNIGQPAANQTVSIQLIPYKYYKGIYQQVVTELPIVGNQGGDEKEKKAEKVLVWQKYPDTMCSAEDKNHNSRIDTGEDINHNNKLDPQNPVTILPANSAGSENEALKNGAVTFEGVTDASGKLDFQIRYGKNFAEWFEGKLLVTTYIDGSPVQDKRIIDLPSAVDDVEKDKGIFPNKRSPYGIATSCIDPN